MPKNLAHDTAVTATGLSRLLEVYKGKPRIAALLKSWLDEFQELEDAGYSLYLDRLVQNGGVSGDLLDKIGKIVGQVRDGLSDDEFLILITARIRVNRSNATREDLITIANLLAPGLTLIIKNLPPASVYVSPFGALPVPPQLAGPQFLSRAVAAGVLLMFVWTQVSANNTLLLGSAWGGSAGTITQSPGSTYIMGTTGGVFAGVFEVYGGAA